MVFVSDSKDVARDAGGVCAHPNLIKILRCSVGVCYGSKSIANVGIGDCFILAVLAIQEPQLSSGHHFLNHQVQLLHVAALMFRLTGDILRDLFLNVHFYLYFNEVNLAKK